MITTNNKDNIKEAVLDIVEDIFDIDGLAGCKINISVETASVPVVTAEIKCVALKKER